MNDTGTHVQPRKNGRQVALQDGRVFKASMSECGSAVCYELPALDGITVTRIALSHEALSAMVVLSADLRAIEGDAA